MSVLHKISGCDDADRKADVVFIHGLGGDAFETWRFGESDNTSWPHWLGEEFPDVGVWSIGYAASPTKLLRVLGWFRDEWRDKGHSMALTDRARQLLNLMLQHKLGERPLLFICHSLGGLVAKQILRASNDAIAGGSNRNARIAQNMRAVLFVATPHSGAALASLLDSFSAAFGSTVSIEDLRAHDPHLRDLYNWYRNHAPALGITTQTYYESRGVKGVLPIVNPTSAHPGVGADPIELEEDHLSIAKPRSKSAQICGAARDLLRDHVLTAPAAGPAQALAPISATPAPPTVIVNIDATAFAHAPSQTHPTVPFESPPAAEKYFGRADEQARLAQRLRDGKHSAVVGAAGLGKTALAAEAVHAALGSSSASLAASPFPDGVVFLDLYAFHGDVERAWGALANKLAGADFMERSPARDRATAACQGRRVLVIIEGGEEADGLDGRASVTELFSVLSSQNRWLLLTRLSTQAEVWVTVSLKDSLDPPDAALLLDEHTQGKLAPAIRQNVLTLLEGHPLALTWAGNLLARGDEDSAELVADWQQQQLPALSDPTRAQLTLEWLFGRSIRRLDSAARTTLAAAGLLARTPFSKAAIIAALQANADISSATASDAARAAIKSLVQRGLLQQSSETGHWQFTHVLGYRFARRETGSDAEMRAALGAWFHQHLKQLLSDAAAAENIDAIISALSHVSALLRTDDNQRLWQPLAEDTMHDFSDRLTDRGRLSLVKLALEAVGDWLERLPKHEAAQPAWQRTRSVLLNQQSDVLLTQGDLAGALTGFQASRDIAERLAKADPSNAGWQRDLSVSHIKVADVLRAQGDLAGALTGFKASRDIRERLAKADPSNAGWQRDLSFSLTRLAEFHEGKGDRASALRDAKASLQIDERLAGLDPSNATWQTDVRVSRAMVERLGG